MRQIALLFEELLERAGFSRGEAFEGVARGWQAGEQQCEFYAAGAGKHGVGQALSGKGANDAVARVANAGVAAIGAEGHGGAGLHEPGDAPRDLLFIALPIGKEGWPRDIEGREELPGAPRVFAGDDWGRGEGGANAGRSIGQIAQRRGHHIELWREGGIRFGGGGGRRHGEAGDARAGRSQGEEPGRSGEGGLLVVGG